MPENFVKNFAKSFSLFIGFGASALLVSILISYLLYHPKKMAKRGFEVEIKIAAQNVNSTKSSKSANQPSRAPQEQLADIAAMIKSADIDAGAKVFKKCATCHSVAQGGGNKVGPNLYGVVGRKRASISGFNYSAALQAKAGSWSVEDLNLWLTKPKDFVPGSKMGFAGLKKDKDRANVIAYLKQQGK
jgi:cytochrome c